MHMKLRLCTRNSSNLCGIELLEKNGMLGDCGMLHFMARYSVDADGRRDYCIHILIYPHSHVVVQFASIAD